MYRYELCLCVQFLSNSIHPVTVTLVPLRVIGRTQKCTDVCLNHHAIVNNIYTILPFDSAMLQGPVERAPASTLGSVSETTIDVHVPSSIQLHVLASGSPLRPLPTLDDNVLVKLRQNKKARADARRTLKAAKVTAAKTSTVTKEPKDSSLKQSQVSIKILKANSKEMLSVSHLVPSDARFDPSTWNI